MDGRYLVPGCCVRKILSGIVGCPCGVGDFADSDSFGEGLRTYRSDLINLTVSVVYFHIHRCCAGS